MDSLLERIEENKLDALYLFINETLRDANEFDRFFVSLLGILHQNWSIQRVEVGHEFLTMCTVGDDGLSKQTELFDCVLNLESLRTLIISDGYVPRKDNGSVHTQSLLTALPNARNLTILDLQRLELQAPDQVQLLAEGLNFLQDSLEDIRITGLSLRKGETGPIDDGKYGLDCAIQACINMPHLRSLAISASTNSTTLRGMGNVTAGHPNIVNGTAHQPAVAQAAHAARDNAPASSTVYEASCRQWISKELLSKLCQNDITTLQDLSLRNMNLDDDTCRAIATALTSNSFLTSLDIRQNELIGHAGYTAILQALERNYDLWCTVMVDNDFFQAKFNCLIELNQANRGDLVRRPTREKLATFIETISKDTAALWYFLTIHDTVLYPLVEFLQWKLRHERHKKDEHRPLAAVATAKVATLTSANTKQSPELKRHPRDEELNNPAKRTKEN